MSRPAGYGERRLPPEFAPRIRAAAAGGVSVVAARHAATVVLLRDGAQGLEAYLLRRSSSMAFAAGMHVFPGGSVDPRDEALPPSCWTGQPAQDWAPALSATLPLARALVCAAVRETFEETGVLLAGTSGADGEDPDNRRTAVLADVSGESWEADRLGLLDGSSPLAAILARRRLVLRADLLRPWAHWITPELEPRRYDTRFFVAGLPAGQRTRHVGGEADAVAWLRPQTALDAAAAGEVGLMPPTALTLAELRSYRTVDAVLAAAQSRDVRPVLPRLVIREGEVLVLLPGEPGYDS